MKTKYLIAIDDFCENHNIDVSFISSLEQTGLIEITTIEESGFIPADQLLQLEKYVRFYYEMDINLEGIETVSYLLQKIDTLQHELGSLRNRLRLYESE
jgi:chaperone modulatory protein CbpM